MRHIVSALDLKADELEQLFKLTKARSVYGTIGSGPFRNRLILTLFYEPSTRTQLSFETAIKRGGGDCSNPQDPEKFSSEAKGETFADTIRVVSGYFDLIVVRHKEEGRAKIASECSRVPVINAGDGSNEHPTQGFLDLYMVWRAVEESRLGRNKKLTIGFYGDVRNSRTVISFLRLLAHYAPRLLGFMPEVRFGGPEKYGRLKPEIIEEVRKLGLPLAYRGELPDPDVDVLYLTRPQAERDVEERDELPESAKIKLAFVQKMPRHAIILHPLPRNSELAEEVDGDPRAWYFKQSDAGVPLRYALMEMLFSGALV